MEIKKLDNDSYEIIKDDYIIYIIKEKNPDTEHYLYFVDVFLEANDDDYEHEIFDDRDLAWEYVKDNYNVEVINERI
jgi:hypothetical protein